MKVNWVLNRRIQVTKIGQVAACFLFSSPLQNDHMLYLHFLATAELHADTVLLLILFFHCSTSVQRRHFVNSCNVVIKSNTYILKQNSRHMCLLSMQASLSKCHVECCNGWKTKLLSPICISETNFVQAYNLSASENLFWEMFRYELGTHNQRYRT